jgi:propanol-preferring alcohol dehydrogenase
VKAHIHEAKLDDINQIFTDLKAGQIDGRMVLTL